MCWWLVVLSKLRITAKLSRFCFSYSNYHIFTFQLSILGAMFSKFCFSRFHGKFQLSQCCFSVINFRRTTFKFLFLRFYCQIPIFTLLLARFNFYASALKTFGGNNCLFSNWICLRNFGANCHQRSGAWRGWGLKMKDFSVKHKFSKYKTIYPLSLKPQSCQTAVELNLR